MPSDEYPDHQPSEPAREQQPASRYRGTPPEVAVRPGYGAPQQGSGEMSVPAWLTTDWALSAHVAFFGQMFLLMGATLLTVIGVLRQTAAVGLDRVDWAATAVRPLVELLGIGGAGTGEPLLLTGLLYSFVAYRMIALRHPRTLAMISADKPRALAAGAKVSLVSAAFLLAIAVLLNSFADSLAIRAPAIAMSTPVDFTSLVFFTVFVGYVPAFLALLRGANLTLVGFLGFKASSPGAFRAGLTGGQRTLLVGGASLLTLQTVGNLLDSFGTNSSFGVVVGELILTIERLVVLWADLGVLLMLGAAKFLHAGGYVWSTVSMVQAWMWVSLPLLAVAYVVGGIAAAKLVAARSQVEAMKAAMLVGPSVALVSLVVAIGWVGQPYIEDIVPIAVLLPSLWGILAMGGAWLWASQQGFTSGFVIGDSAQQTEPAPVPPERGRPPEAQDLPSWAPPTGAPDERQWAPPTGAPDERRFGQPADNEPATGQDHGDDIDADALPPPDTQEKES